MEEKSWRKALGEKRVIEENSDTKLQRKLGEGYKSNKNKKKLTGYFANRSINIHERKFFALFPLTGFRYFISCPIHRILGQATQAE